MSLARIEIFELSIIYSVLSLYIELYIYQTRSIENGIILQSKLMFFMS